MAIACRDRDWPPMRREDSFDLELKLGEVEFWDKTVAVDTSGISKVNVFGELEREPCNVGWADPLQAYGNVASNCVSSMKMFTLRNSRLSTSKLVAHLQCLTSTIPVAALSNIEGVLPDFGWCSRYRRLRYQGRDCHLTQSPGHHVWLSSRCPT